MGQFVGYTFRSRTQLTQLEDMDAVVWYSPRVPASWGAVWWGSASTSCCGRLFSSMKDWLDGDASERYTFQHESVPTNVVQYIQTHFHPQTKRWYVSWILPLLSPNLNHTTAGLCHIISKHPLEWKYKVVDHFWIHAQFLHKLTLLMYEGNIFLECFKFSSSTFLKSVRTFLHPGRTTFWSALSSGTVREKYVPFSYL